MTQIDRGRIDEIVAELTEASHCISNEESEYWAALCATYPVVLTVGSSHFTDELFAELEDQYKHFKENYKYVTEEVTVTRTVKRLEYTE